MGLAAPSVKQTLGVGSAVYSVAFSSDGRTLANGGEDSAVKV